ncbi:MAG TPA: hypothetical protein VMU37_00180, partial [Caulobacteraceae bacterium]|nr:hypothetical protein [Caulobacteraceae bacterium]
MMKLASMRAAVLAAGLALAAPAHAQHWKLAAETAALRVAIQKNDCDAILPAARLMIADPDFDLDPEWVRVSVYSLAAQCAARTSQHEEALEDARRATDLGDDSVGWTVRIEEAAFLNRPDELAKSVRRLGQLDRRALDAIPDQIFYRLINKAHDPASREQAASVLAALEVANYTPSAPFARPDGLWLTYAQIEADTGNREHADKLLRRVGDVYSLMGAALDGRFSGEVAADPARFDVRAAQERQLTADQAAMTAHPELLEAVVMTISDLRALERYDEALALAQRTLDRLAAGPTPFTDLAGELSDLNEAKADVLLDLGRDSDAVAAERQATRFGRHGQANVSQVINLAGFLTETGDPEAALADLKVFDGADAPNASPYGVAWVHSERACADQQLNRTADAAAEMAYLSAHARDNPNAQLKALLCQNDLDDAAAEMKTLLQDPGQRVLALTYLVQWDLPPHFTPLGAVLHARFESVAARPDVQ